METRLHVAGIRPDSIKLNFLRSFLLLSLFLVLFFSFSFGRPWMSENVCEVVSGVRGQGVVASLQERRGLHVNSSRLRQRTWVQGVALYDGACYCASEGLRTNEAVTVTTEAVGGNCSANSHLLFFFLSSTLFGSGRSETGSQSWRVISAEGLSGSVGGPQSWRVIACPPGTN